MTERKQFTPEFKIEIAKLMVDQNHTLQEACKAANAGESAVRRWRAQYLAEKQGNTNPNKFSYQCRPTARAKGSDVIGLQSKSIPSLAAGINNVVIVFEASVCPI